MCIRFSDSGPGPDLACLFCVCVQTETQHTAPCGGVMFLSTSATDIIPARLLQARGCYTFSSIKTFLIGPRRVYVCVSAHVSLYTCVCRFSLQSLCLSHTYTHTPPHIQNPQDVKNFTNVSFPHTSKLLLCQVSFSWSITHFL